MVELVAPALDLTRHRGIYVHGDITVYESWWMADEDGPQPCLALMPTNRQHYEKAKPAVVTVKTAWLWSEEIGDGAYAARTSSSFADGLGFDRLDMHTCMRIRSIIVDHLGDLLSMPPRPPEMDRHLILGEAKMTDHYGKTRHTEITERV